MQRRMVFQVASLTASIPELLHFNTSTLDLAPVMFQTGYLTLATRPEGFEPAELKYPNQEVRDALNLFLLREYAGTSIANHTAYRIRRAVFALDFDAMAAEFNALLAGLHPGAPTPGFADDHWVGQNEAFFHAIFYLVLRVVGLDVRSEVHTSYGRCDLLLELPEAVVVIEFKLDQPAAGLEQIADRGYLEPFATDGRRLIAVGVRVGSVEKQVLEWEVIENLAFKI